MKTIMTFPVIEYRTPDQLAYVERVKKRKGESRWTACFYDKLEYDEWVFRSYRGEWGYLVRKDQFTWGKLSTKHGDFGFKDSMIQDIDRRKFLLHKGLPDRKTKVGALIDLAADLRRQIKLYGEDFIEDYVGEEEPEPSLKIKLKRVLAAQKRLSR